jgi:hypothetical protein
MIDWLNRQRIPFDYINQNAPENIIEYENDGRKIFADVYIDDKGILGLPSWNRIYSIISSKNNMKRNTSQRVFPYLHKNKK